jgi:L-lactate dehydrogenase complex protein LldG
VDRDAFLSRVSTAALLARLPVPPQVPERLPDPEPADLVGLFRVRSQSVNAVVHGPVDRHRAPAAVAAVAARHGCESFMSWDELPGAGVAAALTAAGLEKVEHDMRPERRLEHQLGYRDLALGVTGAAAGLAESGSVVLVHGPGRPRMASLIPEVHVALLDVSDIDRTLAHWTHRHPETVRNTSNLVVITGPSRTGDIELQLNLGVHGPRHLHVVLIK